MQVCLNLWFRLNKIDTTFVSRSRAFIPRSRLCSWVFLTKLPNHGIEAIDFGWVSVINRVEIMDRWLESRNGHFLVGQISRIHNLRHNSSVPDSLLSCFRAAERSKPARIGPSGSVRLSGVTPGDREGLRFRRGIYNALCRAITSSSMKLAFSIRARICQKARPPRPRWPMCALSSGLPTDRTRAIAE